MSEKKTQTGLVEVYRGFNIAEADLRRAVLEAAGVKVLLKDDLAAQNLEGWSLAAGGVKLLVRAEDEKTARLILAADAPHEAE